MKSTVKTVEQALGIVAEIVAVRKRWGRQGSVPYAIDQIMDAIVLLAEEGALSNKEELTKLRRQLAACMNREKGRKDSPGITVTIPSKAGGYDDSDSM